MWLVVAILVLTAVIEYLLARGWWLMAVPYAMEFLCLAGIILDPAMAEGVEDD
jgi:hypothetical protein